MVAHKWTTLASRVTIRVMTNINRRQLLLSLPALAMAPRMLTQHGFTKADAGDPGLSGGAMKVRVSKRGPENGGAKEGTPELFLGDPDGFVVQLQDTSYCGGAGALGNVCLANPEPAPKKGLLAVKD